MPKFQNKMIQKAYNNAIGKEFTWSPTYKKFTDHNGNSDYDYWAMIFLKENGFFEERFDVCYKYKLKNA